MAFATVSNAFAGGLLTNTNQNAAFVRNFAQEGKIDITSIYANPAGGAFLENGWHLSLNNQTAFQQRNIETTFPLFQYNTENPNTTHRFEGKATAPVIPSFTVSYNKDKWSVSAHFAICGGGGMCKFDKGLGSFEKIGADIRGGLANVIEQQIRGNMSGYPNAIIEQTLASAVPDRYSMSSNMKGKSYHFGLQIGGTYKFTDKVAGYVGVRGLYASANYNGYVGDLKLSNSQTGSTALPATLGGTEYSTLVRQSLESKGYSNVDPAIELNCDQVGFGATIILGVDYKINDKWNVSAKYECPTRLNLKNKSEMNELAALQAKEKDNVLSQFADGEHVREDIPALLALGAQYSPIEKVRLCASYHQFFDKVSTKFLNKEELIDHNTHEFILGAEYDICKWLTVSGSWETTRYGMNDEFMNDLSFNLSNHMVGAGVRVKASKRLNFDLGYMCTFYQNREVITQTAAGPKTDVYDRKNHTFGIGVNLDL